MVTKAGFCLHLSFRWRYCYWECCLELTSKTSYKIHRCQIQEYVIVTYIPNIFLINWHYLNSMYQTLRVEPQVVEICFIEVPVPSQESERSWICVLVVSYLPLSTTLIFGFLVVPTVWYFLFFILFCHCSVLEVNVDRRWIMHLSSNFLLHFKSRMSLATGPGWLSELSSWIT